MEVYRTQIAQIIKDLAKKMVFLVGPRQVGKTWLSKRVMREFPRAVYLNYDHLEDREIIKKEQWVESTDLLVLDELHKMKGWKNYLKGVYDTKPENLKILVTGSARMETFRQSGDSLAGRFFVHHLLPLSLSEVKGTVHDKGVDGFLERGGFPEPFLAEKKEDADRWRSLYMDSLVRTDVLDFENIHDLKAMQNVFDILRGKVGSPISYSAVARDIGISPATVKKYIYILESLYIVFFVKPYTKKIARAILKEPKIYFFDNGLVRGDMGAKFENFSAVSLLKNLRIKNDSLGGDRKLMYLRTKEGKEADFAIADSERGMEKIIEVKSSDATLSKSLVYFSKKYDIPAEQIVKSLKTERNIDGIEILKAETYFRNLK